MLFIRAAFEVFKSIVRAGGGPPGSAASGALRLSGGAGSGDATAADLQEQVKKLKMQVQQRDNEINILVSTLQRRGAGGQGPVLQASGARPTLNGPLADTSESSRGAGPQQGGTSVSSAADDLTALMNTSLLGDRNKAFELFRKSYRQNEVGGEQRMCCKMLIVCAPAA